LISCGEDTLTTTGCSRHRHDVTSQDENQTAVVDAVNCNEQIADTSQPLPIAVELQMTEGEEGNEKECENEVITYGGDAGAGLKIFPHKKKIRIVTKG